MRQEVWILGAAGRVGRVIASRLHEQGVPLVLVGRDRGRLEGVAAQLGSAPQVVPATLDSD
jgi:short-subunit dehydrogenase